MGWICRLVMVLLIALSGTACIPPERAEDTKKLEDGLKALPGVEAVLVTNHAEFSTTRNLEVRVTVRKDVTADQLAAMQDLYSTHVSKGRYEQTVSPLALAWCDPSDRPDSRFVCTSCPSDSQYPPPDDVCSWVRSMAGDKPPNAEWLRLWRTDYAQNAHLFTSGEKSVFELTVKGYRELVVPTFHRLQADYPSLSGAGWNVTSAGKTLNSPDGFPDDAVLSLWEQFKESAANVASATFRRTPTVAQPNSMTVRMAGYDNELVRSTAVKHLTLLRQFGRPVTYTASGERGPALVVRVGGCSQGDQMWPRSPDSPLQTELRAEFEKC